MPRKRPTFTQADLTRAVKGAQAAGLKVGRVSIDPDGRIDIVFAADAVASSEPSDDYDSWREKRGTR